MSRRIKGLTISELHSQLQALVARGWGDAPILGTDGVAKFPFEIYTVMDVKSDVAAVLLRMRPDIDASEENLHKEKQSHAQA